MRGVHEQLGLKLRGPVEEKPSLKVCRAVPSEGGEHLRELFGRDDPGEVFEAKGAGAWLRLKRLFVLAHLCLIPRAPSPLHLEVGMMGVMSNPHDDLSRTPPVPSKVIPEGAADPNVISVLDRHHDRLEEAIGWERENYRAIGEVKTAIKGFASSVLAAQQNTAQTLEAQRVYGEQLQDFRQETKKALGEMSEQIGRLAADAASDQKINAAQTQELAVVKEKYSTLTVAKFGAGAGAVIAVSEALRWVAKVLWAAIFGA